MFVDGKPLGVLRIHEMPGKLKTHPQKLQDGRLVPRYRIAEYLQTLGVDLQKIKQVHIFGGRNRASIIDGSELLKFEKTLQFSFSRGDSGKARMEWPDAPIKVNTTIDTIVAIAVYVDKPLPRYDRERRIFTDENGKVFDVIPYTKPEESLRGTRVYRDGALVSSVKRKKLPDSVLAASYTPTNPRFSLAKYLSSVQVDPARVKEIIALRGDFVVHHFKPEEWKKEAESIEFSMAQGAEGRMVLHLPGQPEGRPVSAIVVYDQDSPQKRILSAERDEPGPGSEPDQPKPE